MVILEKLKAQLEQLKAKIPFLNKGASKDADEESSDDDEEQDEKPSSSEPAWKAAVAKQLPFLAKFLGGKPAPAKPLNEDATDANIKIPTASNSEEKRKKIIRIVLILGALYVAYDTLMPTEEAPPEVVAEEKPDRPKGKMALKREAEAKAKKEAEEAAAKAAAADPTATVPVATTETPAATDPVAADPTTATTPPSTDMIPEAPADIPPETDASAPIEGTAGTIAPDIDPVEAADAATATTDLGIPQDDPFATGDVPPATGDDAATQPTGMGADTGTDQVVEGDKPVEGGDMTEQILKDLEKQIGTDQAATEAAVSTTYINPPEYDNVGRGLVYNCTGKHWACVDGPSFKICQQNNAALKNQNRPKECYPDSVYQSDSSCGWVQKQKITGNAKTDFCN